MGRMWHCLGLHYNILVLVFAGCSAVDSSPLVPSQSHRSSSCGLPGTRQREGCTPGEHGTDDDESSLMQSRVKLEAEANSWSETELLLHPVLSQLAASSSLSSFNSKDTNAKASPTTLAAGVNNEASKGIPLLDLEEDGSELKSHTDSVLDKMTSAGKSILDPSHKEAALPPVLTDGKVALAQLLQQSQSAAADIAGRLGTSTGSGDFVWTGAIIFVGFLWLGAFFIFCCLLRSPKEPQREDTGSQRSAPVRNSPLLSQTMIPAVRGVESGRSPANAQLMPNEPQARWPVSKVPVAAGRTTPQAPSSYVGQPRQAAQPRQGPADASALQSLVSLPGSSSSTPGSGATNTGSFGTSMQQGIPLCCALIIPDGSRLVCLIRTELRNEKQNLEFNILGAVERGRTPLFSISVNEFGENPGISVQTLKTNEAESELLAHASTEDLWNLPQGSTMSPALRIYRASGALYGMVQKVENGDYHVMRGHTHLLTLSGNFQNHDVEITAASGRVVASVNPIPGAPEEYQMQVQARVDSGLVVLALLCIDKCERRA